MQKFGTWAGIPEWNIHPLQIQYILATGSYDLIHRLDSGVRFQLDHLTLVDRMSKILVGWSGTEEDPRNRREEPCTAVTEDPGWEPPGRRRRE